MDAVITIGRQHGSGGREIGRLLANQLGVSFYDRQALKELAVENGIGKTLLEAYGEKHAAGLLHSLATSAYSFGYYDPAKSASISQKIYQAAFETVREAAKQGPCVIVGRCADYILRDHPGCLSFFIHAPFVARAGEVARRRGTGMKEAELLVRETDRLRRGYYNYYTAKDWGEVDSYHFTADSSLLGNRGTANLLRQIWETGADGIRTSEYIQEQVV